MSPPEIFAWQFCRIRTHLNIAEIFIFCLIVFPRCISSMQHFKRHTFQSEYRFARINTSFLITFLNTYCRHTLCLVYFINSLWNLNTLRLYLNKLLLKNALIRPEPRSCLNQNTKSYYIVDCDNTQLQWRTLPASKLL